MENIQYNNVMNQALSQIFEESLKKITSTPAGDEL
jgi:hypothetical protein